MAALVVGAVSTFGDASQAAAGDVGYPGPSYLGVSGSHPSAEKPESKLWHHDGYWWGSLWSTSAGTFNVHRLDPITKNWIDTGTVLETVGIYRQDTLFDGTKLYVSSHRYATSGGTADARLTRLSYNAGTERWSVDAGFPVNISNHRSETLTIEKDSIGRLWATWTRDAQVWINHTTCSPTCDDKVWGTPVQFGSIPAIGTAATTDSDDISSVVSFNGTVGVMWSNQRLSKVYFARHNDADPTSTWTIETALSGTGQADDHINFATDGSSVFVAVKTSLEGSNPETYILKRTAAGAWSSAVVTLATDRLTRPIVTYDQGANELNWFAADVSGGQVYTKNTSASNPTFGPGKGTPVMTAASTNDLNDPTSTKQSVDASTGLVVVATDNLAKQYWHHEDPLGGTTTLVAGFTATPVSGEAPVQVQFTDTSIGSPTTWSWTFGDGGTSTAQNPAHTYTAPGTYAVSLTVSNLTGSDSEVKTGFITVDPPQPLSAAFSNTPTQGGAPLDVQFTDESTGSPVLWYWEFGDGTTSFERNPAHTYNAVGSYDVKLTVVSASNQVDVTTVANAVQVSNQVVVNPVADAYVRLDRPTANYGGENRLRVRYSTIDNYQSLLKFNVPNASPASAKLRLFVTDGSPEAGDLYVVANSWTELGVNAGNAPALPPTPAVLGGEAVLGTWYEWDVTSLISGAGEYSFRLASPSSNSAIYSSREGANPPQLVISGDVTPPPLAAAFTGSPTTVQVGQPVSFTDQSTGTPTTWSWNFGDTGTSALQNPTHTYTTPGNYTVDLTVGNGVTTSTETKTAYIVVTNPTVLTAAFTGNPVTVQVGQPVSFTDQSTGNPTTWSWNFGDTGTSALQNPTHTYTAQGSYTVALTVGNGVTTSTVTKPFYIVVVPPTGGSQTFAATEDAYVKTSNATRNYGNDTWLRIRQSASETFESFMKFDVTGLVGPPSQVKLRLFVTTASSSAGAVSSVSASAWSESTITWNTRPTTLTPVAPNQPTPAAGQWVEWDVTSAVAGNGAVSFALVSSSSSSAFFSSSEGANAPQLVVTP